MTARSPLYYDSMLVEMSDPELLKWQNKIYQYSQSKSVVLTVNVISLAQQ